MIEQTSMLSSLVVAVDWSVLKNWKVPTFLFFPKWNFFPVEPKIVTTYILIYLMNFCENFWMIDDGFIEILSVYLINLLGFPYFPGLQGWWRVRYSWGIWGPCQSPASFAKQRCLRRCGLHSQQQRHYEFWCPRRPPTPQQQLRTPSNAVTEIGRAHVWTPVTP